MENKLENPKEQDLVVGMYMNNIITLCDADGNVLRNQQGREDQLNHPFS